MLPTIVIICNIFSVYLTTTFINNIHPVYINHKYINNKLMSTIKHIIKPIIVKLSVGEGAKR